MKKLFLILFFGLSVAIGTNANATSIDNTLEDYVIVENPAGTSDYIITVDVSRDENSAFACTIEGKVTVTTEDGDSVSVEFKVTADTCSEAIRVQTKIMEALE